MRVQFLGENANLHSVWDTLFIERIDPSTESYAEKARRRSDGFEYRRVRRGNQSKIGLSGTCRRESLRFDSFCFYFLYLSLYQSSKRTSMPVPSRAFAKI